MHDRSQAAGQRLGVGDQTDVVVEGSGQATALDGELVTEVDASRPAMSCSGNVSTRLKGIAGPAIERRSYPMSDNTIEDLQFAEPHFVRLRSSPPPLTPCRSVATRPPGANY